MILDSRAMAGGAELSGDVAIIGAGGAGVTLAKQLSVTGLRVVLVESGGLDVEDAAPAPIDMDSVGHPAVAAPARRRALGGSTSRWTGRCARLDAKDFEPRSWIAWSGWPIGVETLDPYYRRAERDCGLVGHWSDDIGEGAHRLAPPPLDRTLVRPFSWRYPPHANNAPGGAAPASSMSWRKRFRPVLKRSPKVEVLLHATATGIEVSESGRRVTAIRAQSPEGRSVRITARAYVLSCGGIGNARLLLEAARATGAPFGGDNVGRYFSQHYRRVIASIEADAAQSERLQRTFNIFRTPRGESREIGLTLSHDAQQAEGLLGASAILSYREADSAWRSAKTVWRDLRGGRASPALLAELRSVVSGLDDVAASALRRAGPGPALIRTAGVDVVADLEPSPDPASRITLSEARDALGRPRPQVDWRISELEHRTAERFARHLKTELERHGLGRVEPADWLASSTPVTPEQPGETLHHIGGTRMSESPAEGVVDRDCRVHGMDNLYAAGSSVFPTGGHADPTLTVVALSLRLADHLSATLRLRPSVRLWGEPPRPRRAAADGARALSLQDARPQKDDARRGDDPIPLRRRQPTVGGDSVNRP